VRTTGSSAPSPRMTDEELLGRALELAERGRGTTAPNPVVGAVLVRDGEIVGEGWHEQAGLPHAEIVALEAAGDSARGATLYVTLEPCAHHGRTPPCADALAAAGITRVVAAVGDPNPETDGAGFERLRAAGVIVELPGGEVEWRARVQNEAFRIWVARRRPLVTYKAAVTLDGRVTVPRSRWVTGEVSRRRVHELRAQVDAVAVGMGTVRADDPLLTARGVGAERQPRRLAFGRGPLPAGSELELVEGRLDEALARLAGEGVQSLLLEGGPTLATSFLAGGLVDKLLLFVAPTLAGSGPRWLGELPEPVELLHVQGERVGGDYLVTAYLREP
jgi:diaminohydroxyphosphoribosylaminopyrimidine deaminase / 5-amino-6-(5-phosphoribosylamino)uracil reductase